MAGKKKANKAAARDIRGIAANTARDLALGLRLASLRIESFEPGQGKDAARELAEQLSAAARRAVELYYLESLTQAVAISEGPLKVRRQSELETLGIGEALEIQHLRSEVGGCYNRLGFTLLLECELERSRRRRSPLSLALFKLETVDDVVVEELARQARECCRLLDIVGTFGGRAVAVIFPDTALNGAEVAAQRVVTSYLAALRVEQRGLDEPIRLGTTSYPEDGAEGRELLAGADERAGGYAVFQEVLTEVKTR